MEALAAVLCGCCASQEARDRQERNEVLSKGARFRRKKLTFGFGMGWEDVTMKVKESTATLMWFTSVQEGSNSGEIRLRDVRSVEPKGEIGLTVHSKTGDLLLEVEAVDGQTRDYWVPAIAMAAELPVKGPLPDRPQTSSMRDRAAKQAYFMKRDLELTAKKQLAEQRKAKLMKESGGLKYTALAMASRD
uniref:PH domain-containing protein n=1 Tax=Rhizochromulina marina TaxID=1034831 RepID=A0A7S2SSX7_9STRA|mmetsp:Transcript_682/g.2161  ORF Transcript_682/g.2161 Transcript_682/m.2161 type:complete len:190 (+) Transcript_682:181-750(+)